jgi:tetratricopeptide (TPR) repeat protein
MILGEHNKAINFYEKSLFLTQKMGDKLNECLTLRSLSNFYFSRGDYSQAINFSEKLLTLCELVQESKTKIETLINLAGSHYFLGKTEKAAILFEQCLTDIQILENQPTKVYLLGTIGNIYDFMQEYSKAIDCYQKSLSIAQIINYQQTGGILANLGKTIMKLEQYPEALDILFKAIEQLKKDGIRIGESISILNVAEIYYQLGYIDLALNYYNQALEIAMNLENPQLLEQCKEFNSRLLQF